MQKNENTLSVKAFLKASDFLKEKARPLEFARFESIFATSGTSDVLSELKKFQNADGGFGHALEPDLRCPESSVLCTSIAFQIVHEHDLPPENEIAGKAIRYLAGIFDEDACHWRIIPKTAEAAPHAPWWNQAGREEEFTKFSLNPSAEILGYILNYGASDFDKQSISRLTDRIVAELRSLKAIEMHDLLCCLRLLETESLKQSLREVVLEELQRLALGTVSQNMGEWKGYCLRPLQIVHSPQSPFFESLERSVSQNLDFEIDAQSEDGSWLPTWSWGDSFPEDWLKAQDEWSGVLTLEKLLTLNRFGRLEAKHIKSSLTTPGAAAPYG